MSWAGFLCFVTSKYPFLIAYFFKKKCSSHMPSWNIAERYFCTTLFFWWNEFFQLQTSSLGGLEYNFCPTTCKERRQIQYVEACGVWRRQVSTYLSKHLHRQTRCNWYWTGASAELCIGTRLHLLDFQIVRSISPTLSLFAHEPSHTDSFGAGFDRDVWLRR